MATFEFEVGQIIHHKRFDYRGVVVERDASFSGTEEWYEQVARSRPPKDEPWYEVLVHAAHHTTYVAQQNLEDDPSGQAVIHPLLRLHFDEFEDGRYGIGGPAN
jgi:heat shock protein HspQ